jgi:hypothetical protein
MGIDIRLFLVIDAFSQFSAPWLGPSRSDNGSLAKVDGG